MCELHRPLCIFTVLHLFVSCILISPSLWKQEHSVLCAVALKHTRVALLNARQAKYSAGFNRLCFSVNKHRNKEIPTIFVHHGEYAYITNQFENETAAIRGYLKPTLLKKFPYKVTSSICTLLWFHGECKLPTIDIKDRWFHWVELTVVAYQVRSK